MTRPIAGAPTSAGWYLATLPTPPCQAERTVLSVLTSTGGEMVAVLSEPDGFAVPLNDPQFAGYRWDGPYSSYAEAAAAEVPVRRRALRGTFMTKSGRTFGPAKVVVWDDDRFPRQFCAQSTVPGSVDAALGQMLELRIDGSARALVSIVEIEWSLLSEMTELRVIGCSVVAPNSDA